MLSTALTPSSWKAPILCILSSNWSRHTAMCRWEFIQHSCLDRRLKDTCLIHWHHTKAHNLSYTLTSTNNTEASPRALFLYRALCDNSVFYHSSGILFQWWWWHSRNAPDSWSTPSLFWWVSCVRYYQWMITDETWAERLRHITAWLFKLHIPEVCLESHPEEKHYTTPHCLLYSCGNNIYSPPFVQSWVCERKLPVTLLNERC